MGRVLAARRATRAIPRRAGALPRRRRPLGFPPAVRDDGAGERAGRRARSRCRTLRGYPAVKVKVRDAAGRRARSPRCATRWDRASAVRVDANGAWDVDTAVHDDHASSPRYDLEYVEQPVRDARRPRRGAAAGRRCRSRPTSASARSTTRAELRALDAADVIVLKQQPLGGVRAALDGRGGGGRARGRELDDGDVGRASPPGVALAAALPELPYACGLATLRRARRVT